MKLLTIGLLLMSSLTVFAQNSAGKTGEAASGLDCNPEHWTCDNACQIRKAAACGLNVDEFSAKLHKGGGDAGSQAGGKKVKSE